MDNIYYGLDKDQCITYDMKGCAHKSMVWDWSPQKRETLKDTNFRIDTNGEPI